MKQLLQVILLLTIFTLTIGCAKVDKTIEMPDDPVAPPKNVGTLDPPKPVNDAGK